MTTSRSLQTLLVVCLVQWSQPFMRSVASEVSGDPRRRLSHDRPLSPFFSQAAGSWETAAPCDRLEMHLWDELRGPKCVLVLAKRDPSLLPEVEEIVTYLQDTFDMTVVVERMVMEALLKSPRIRSMVGPEKLRPLLVTDDPTADESKLVVIDGLEDSELQEIVEEEQEDIDAVVTLGGDGLVMHASTLFGSGKPVPPLLCFNMGSMGFLTPFEFHEYRTILDAAFRSPGVPITPRTRLDCSIMRKGGVIEHRHVLNEVVVDRGASPHLSQLECYVDGAHLTTVQADGLIISTPTGSTAYSMSAGGSMVHPSVPAILLTPICPHSLSFRPLMLPATSEVRCEVPEDNRSSAWVSFDGKSRKAMQRGDALVVSTSSVILPTVSRSSTTVDWFSSLQRSFSFNSRVRQKPFFNGGDPGTGEREAMAPEEPRKSLEAAEPMEPVEAMDAQMKTNSEV
eukprot:scaffold2044_cov247-Pinguiococcus_pyrenoidosus.AAC.7